MKTKLNLFVQALFLLLALLISNYMLAQAPVANFSANPSSGCEPLTVNFTDSSTNAPTSWSWDFGDGSPIDTFQNPVHIYLSGTYNVMLVVSNSFGSDTIINSIVVNPSTIAGFTYNGNQCLSGNSYAFTNTGTSGCSYTWNFGDAMGTSTLQNPTYSYAICGSFTVIQTVTCGACSDATSVVVTVFCEPSIDSIAGTNITCNGACNGAADLTFAECTTPSYTYSWSNGDTTQDITDLCPGVYSITVTDSNGCTDSTASGAISEPTALAISFTVFDASCNACDGGLIANVSGGTPGYTYLWNTGAITQSIPNLCAGVYTLTVIDAFGCAATANAIVGESLAFSLTMSSIDTSCFGCCDGQATGSAFGGIAPYTYQWNDPLFQTTQTATGLCAGTYCVTVTDSNACTANNCVIVADTSCTITLTTTSIEATCSLCNGNATASPTSGAAPYTFLWDDPALQTDSTAINLCAGSYTVQVTDLYGCSVVDTVMVADSGTFTLAISSTDISCNGDSTGSATVTPSGGIPSYFYSWIPTGGVDSIATGLIAATYIVSGV